MYGLLFSVNLWVFLRASAKSILQLHGMLSAENGQLELLGKN